MDNRHGALISLFAGFLLAAIAAPAPLAAADSVQMQLAPATVQVAAGETGHVLLVLKNDGASAIGGVKLQWSDDPGVTVSPDQPLPGSVEAHSAVAVPLSVTRPAPDRGAGKLNFWVTWSGSSRGTVVGALDVQDPSFLSIDKLATIRLEAAVDHLDENQSALLYIIVGNTGPVPLTIRGLTNFSPRFIALTAKTKIDGVVLQPQESRTFPVEASVTDQAFAGNQRVVIQADLAWRDNGTPRTGTLSVAQTLPVTIFAESDLLKLLGVPSFLFLPGFLFLITFHSLWTRVSPRTKPAVSASTSETALISVSLSFLSALIYPRFLHRNYLQGYGVRDVMNVWFGSIVAAFIVWGLIVIVRLANRWIRGWLQHRAAESAARENAARIRERTPTKDDSPLDMLARMSLAGMHPPPEQVNVSLADSRPARSFVVMKPTQDDPRYWIAPPIRLQAKQVIASPWSRSDIAAKLQQPNVRDSYEHLAPLLTGAKSAGWTVEWSESGAVIGPTPVASSEVKDVDPAQGFEFVQFSP